MPQTGRSLLFVALSRETIGRPYEEIVARSPALRKFAENFRDNLYAVSTVCSLPTQIGGLLMHQRLVLANEIDAGAHHAATEEALRIKKDAYAKAAVQVKERIAQSMDPILDEAEPIAEALSSTIEELLREGLVLIWGAIEVVASDLFCELLNTNPTLVARLNDSEPARRLFGVKALGIDLLETYGFDLRGSMGSIVLSQHAVDNVPSIKVAYAALFPDDAELKTQLNRPELFLLNQQRNLIVHRRGVVDEDYRRKVKTAPQSGQRIKVRAEDIASNLALARDVGVALLQASSTTLRGRTAAPGGGG